LTAKDKILSFQLVERKGFGLFTLLIRQLSDSNNSMEKTKLFTDYFSMAPDADKTFAIALFTGMKLKRIVKNSILSSWVTEIMNIPEWLLDECYKQVKPYETLALLFQQDRICTKTDNLADYIHLLNQRKYLMKKKSIVTCWKTMNDIDKIVFNKLITGGFRSFVSAQLIHQSLAQLLNEEPAVLAHRLSGKWDAMYYI
jgi:DNA ligase-1